jgi:hypothetical protein
MQKKERIAALKDATLPFFESVDKRFDEVEERLAEVNESAAKIERKLKADTKAKRPGVAKPTR